jgi:osmotically-inducible protein OsmY
MITATSTQMNRMTDRELTKAIQDELCWEPSIDGREIDVKVKDGVATLTGRVGNFFVKWEAGSAVRRVHGVSAVANDIEVQLPTDGRRSDTDIARAAADVLAWNVSLPTARILVDVYDGWITLNGDVDWGYQSWAAENAVRRLLDVRGVTNEISVKPSGVPTDVKARIEAAFRRSAAVDAARIRVETNGGQVTLRGDVGSSLERDEAERSAWAAQGVTNVENFINVALFPE